MTNDLGRKAMTMVKRNGGAPLGKYATGKLPITSSAINVTISCGEQLFLNIRPPVEVALALCDRRFSNDITDLGYYSAFKFPIGISIGVS